MGNSIYSKSRVLTPLEQLDDVIATTVRHIEDFRKNPNDFTRDRKLNVTSTIKTTLNMEGQSLNTELIHAFPNMDDRVTASAYEQQKSKLSSKLFEHLLREYNKTNTNHALYEGKYQLFAIDGSDFNMPYQSKSKYAINIQNGRPRKDGEPTKPFCQLHGNLLFNLTDRTYEDIIIQPKSSVDERSAAIDMLNRLNPDNPYIVIMDRGYDGFNMIEHGNRLNSDGYYVIRTKAGEGGIKEISRLPNEDCDIDFDFWVTTSGKFYLDNKNNEEHLHFVRCPKNPHTENYSPNTRNGRWDFKQFEHVRCRICKFRINDTETGKEAWEVLITNLNRFEFPLRKMKELYHMRWDIETSFRELKYALGAVQFHSRKDEFVEIELIAHLIMFNAVSRTINKVKVPQAKTKKYKYVVSFKDAVTLIRKYYRTYNSESPNRIYAEMYGYTRPVIGGRSDKRHMKPKSAIEFVFRVA